MDNRANDWQQDHHWKVINAGGRQISNTPEQLWSQAVEYFRWCDDNPMKAKRTLTSGKTQGEKVTIEFVRPYSIQGFCLHASVSASYLKDLIESKMKDSEWTMVAEKIMMIIYTQNLEGAVVDLYNPIMVSKILNMDKGADTNDKPVRVEVVTSQQNTLDSSENEVLQNLDFEKVEILKEKLQNPKEKNLEEE